MAPLSYEIQAVSSCTPQHIGPAIPEVRLYDIAYIILFIDMRCLFGQHNSEMFYYLKSCINTYTQSCLKPLSHTWKSMFKSWRSCAVWIPVLTWQYLLGPKFAWHYIGKYCGPMLCGCDAFVVLVVPSMSATTQSPLLQCLGHPSSY